MKWDINENKAIHPQIVDEIIRRIINEEYFLSEKIPSVRDLAIEAKVNPNTMQKALIELEDKGIIHTQRTSGKYVTSNKELIENLKIKTANKITREFIQNMKNLNFNTTDIIKIIKKEMEETNDSL